MCIKWNLKLMRVRRARVSHALDTVRSRLFSAKFLRFPFLTHELFNTHFQLSGMTARKALAAMPGAWKRGENGAEKRNWFHSRLLLKIDKVCRNEWGCVGTQFSWIQNNVFRVHESAILRIIRSRCLSFLFAFCLHRNIENTKARGCFLSIFRAFFLIPFMRFIVRRCVVIRVFFFRKTNGADIPSCALFCCLFVFYFPSRWMKTQHKCLCKWLLSVERTQYHISGVFHCSTMRCNDEVNGFANRSLVLFSSVGLFSADGIVVVRFSFAAVALSFHLRYSFCDLTQYICCDAFTHRHRNAIPLFRPRRACERVRSN